MGASFDYSLIRVVPDRRRGEWANVGVCVYLRGMLDIRIHHNHSKLRALHPALNLAFLADLPAAWNALAGGDASAEDRQAILARMPLAHASPIARFTCDISEYDRELDAILRDLVVPPLGRAQRIHDPRLVTDLKNKFIKARLFSANPDDIHAHRVIQRYPVMAQANLYADFAIKNGVLRLTETLDFRAQRTTIQHDKPGQAALKAITLERATKLHQGCIPSVVYACRPEDRELIQPSLNLLADSAQRLYDAGSADDMASYMDMMHAAAGNRLGTH